MVLQDKDGNKMEKKVKEQEKKEKDMIIFQEMITIPNQEEIDELVEGNIEIRTTRTTRLIDLITQLLFLRLGLPSTLIRHENEAFRKRSSNRRNFRTPALSFRVDGKHFENRAFRKRWRYNNNDNSPARVFLEYKSKMSADCCVFRMSYIAAFTQDLVFSLGSCISKHLRTFARKFSNVDFFLRLLPLKVDELVLSEM